MPIICVEGPRAVGKTTVCLELQDVYGAYIISNLPVDQNEDIWKQCDRQIERWQLAEEKSKKFAVVVLDGDVFSPLIHLASLQHEHDKNTYKQIEPFQYAFMDEKIGFADQYFYLQASEATIQKRKLKKQKQHYNNINYGYYYENFSEMLAEKFHRIQAVHEKKSARQVMHKLSTKPWERYNRKIFQHMRTLLLQENRL
ncbi:hypothetical protein D7Z54_24935 [Salibacterium salarium]|uniref:Uncharacterized protein n=1 Tax=Salibacterium salarium TaxID=284579 RepID=A0A3R9P194_9BACI|nr:hypothetical protein [Salibacterium salarium]RSL30611.1 hypothetical protein D7Z54_24935 [Salibacterium salarium]